MPASMASSNPQRQITVEAGEAFRRCSIHTRQRVLSVGVPTDAIRWRACIITDSISRPMSSRRSAYLAAS